MPQGVQDKRRNNHRQYRWRIRHRNPWDYSGDRYIDCRIFMVSLLAIIEALPTCSKRKNGQVERTDETHYKTSAGKTTPRRFSTIEKEVLIIFSTPRSGTITLMHKIQVSRSENPLESLASTFPSSRIFCDSTIELTIEILCKWRGRN